MQTYQTEDILKAVFKNSDTVVAIETARKDEWLHRELGYDSMSLDDKGNVRITSIHDKYHVSETVSEGAIDHREVEIVKQEYKQSDIVRLLLQAREEWLRTETTKDLLDTLGVLEMDGRKTIKISDVRYLLTPSKE